MGRQHKCNQRIYMHFLHIEILEFFYAQRHHKTISLSNKITQNILLKCRRKLPHSINFHKISIFCLKFIEVWRNNEKTFCPNKEKKTRENYLPETVVDDVVDESILLSLLLRFVVDFPGTQLVVVPAVLLLLALLCFFDFQSFILLLPMRFFLVYFFPSVFHGEFIRHLSFSTKIHSKPRRTHIIKEKAENCLRFIGEHFSYFYSVCLTPAHTCT